MANIDGTLVEGNDGVAVVEWKNLAASDVGKPVNMARWPRKTIGLTGTGTAKVEGSNDGTTWVNLTNKATGDDLSALASTDLVVIHENPANIRVTISGGTGTTVTIIGAK